MRFGRCTGWTRPVPATAGALALRPIDADTQYHQSMLGHPRGATCRQAGCGVNGAGKAPNLGWRAPPDGNGPNGRTNRPRARRCCSAPNRDPAICRISAAMPDWPPLGVARDRRGAIAADPLAAKSRRRGAGRCLADGSWTRWIAPSRGSLWTCGSSPQAAWRRQYASAQSRLFVDRQTRQDTLKPALRCD